MEMHNIKDNPDVMKEIAKEMEKAAKKGKPVEPVECWFGGIKVTFNRLLLREGSYYYYITPNKPHSFTARYYIIESGVHLRKTNSPYAAYPINGLIEIVKSGDFSFC